MYGLRAVYNMFYLFIFLRRVQSVRFYRKLHFRSRFNMKRSVC